MRSPGTSLRADPRHILVAAGDVLDGTLDIAVAGLAWWGLSESVLETSDN